MGILAGDAAEAQVRVAATEGGAQPAALSNEAPALSSSGPIRGPILGYVFEARSRNLKPLLGLPGASHIGTPLLLGQRLAFAEVSSSQDYALAVEAVSGELRLIDLRAEFPALRPIAGVGLGVDRIVFSPGGASAALYGRQSRQVQLLAGLPEEPSSEGKIDLTQLPGVLTALAVSDDARALLAAVSEGDGGALYLASPGESPRRVAPAGRVSSIAFFRDSKDALLADYQNNEILRIRDVSGSAELTVLASERDGIRRPLAVAASRDNRLAFAASAATRSVALVPLEGGVTTMLPCDCAPASLLPLKWNSVFQMTAGADSPIYLLDAGRAGAGRDPRILFVPPAENADSSAPGALAPAPRGRVKR